MAFTLTYGSLSTTVISYLQNASEDVIGQLDTFIMLAQRRLSKDAKILTAESYIDRQFVVNNPLLVKPDAWRNTLSFTVRSGDDQNYTPLLLRSFEYCLLYNKGNLSGFPVYYADYGFNNWLVSPIPDKVYKVRIAYFALPPLLDSDTAQNWFTINAPECLIYATLYETASYLKDDQRMNTWMTLYSKALESLNAEDERRKQDRTVNRAAD